ncbi:MAG: arylesterase [Rhizobiaceae bacterium]|nr:arylesterase [Rhizobiaceae bacterium]
MQGWTRRFYILMISVLFAMGSSTVFSSDHDQGPTIVVFGDSLVAGYQLPAGAAYPDRLQIALQNKGVSANIIGAGVSGDTSSGGLSRLAWSVADGTDAVILELGANDALRGLPPKTTADNLEKMVQQLLDRNIKVLLVGILAPPNMGEDYAAAFNPIYQQLADKYDLPLYPFFLDGVITVEGMTIADGMHPNEQGVDVMVEKMLPMVERLIEELRPTP